MADRNQLKKAPDSQISDDDPFAELTRIMGFDPRVPVTPRQPPAMERLAALAAEEDDFSIDLEKELMGDFDGLDEDVQATSYAAEPAPQVAQDQDNAPVEDFDFVFDADLAAPEQDPAIAAAAHQALADELDAAFSAEPVRQSHAVETNAMAFAGETLVAQPVAYAVEEPVAAAAAPLVDEVAEEYETAFTNDVEQPAELQAFDDDMLAGQRDAAFAQDAVAEDVYATPEAAHQDILADEIGDTFAVHFDDSLAADMAELPAAVEPEIEAPVAIEPEFFAEPDLISEISEADFAAVAAEAPETVVAAPEPVAEHVEAYEETEDAPLIPLGAARDFARADDHFAPIDVNFDTELTRELAQSFDAPASDEAEADDCDLESELSALLGKGKSVAAPAIPAETTAYDEPAYATADEPVVSMDDDWSVDREDPRPMAAEAVAEPEYFADEAPEAYTDEAPETHAEPYFEEPALAHEAADEIAGQDAGYQPEVEAPAYVAEQPAYAPVAYAVAASAPAAYAVTAHYAPVAEAPVAFAAPAHVEAPNEAVAEATAWQQPALEEEDPLSEFVVEQELEAELAGLEDDIDLGLDDLVLDDEPYAAAVDTPRFEAPVHAASPAMTAPAQPVVFEQPPVATASFAPQPAPKAPQPAPAVAEDDPFAMLAAMVRETPAVAQQPVRSPAPASMSFQDLPRSEAPKVSESSVPTPEYQYQSRSYANRAPVDVPDIDTIDVHESAVALADDLDIPDISFEDDLPPATDFEDFEAELASAFNPLPVAQPAAEPVRDVPRQAYQHEYARYQQPAPAEQGYYGAATAAAAASTAYAPAQPAQHASYADENYGDFDGRAPAGGQAQGDYRAVDEDDLAYDPELNEAIPSYHEAAERQPAGSRRGLLIAALLGGVVLVGGIGAYALSGGGSGSGAPALVRADTDPVKVRPENPGGTSVPNQDNKVFQTMNGTDKATGPAQEKLISGTEEPVDVTARAEPRVVTPQQPAQDGEDAPLMADDEMAGQDPVAAEIAAAPKGEDRVAPSATTPTTNSDTVAVAPRRVRTMIVRADGTLVPSEAPAPVTAEPPADQATASALEPADPSRSLADPIAPEATGSLQPAAPAETAAAPTARAAAPAARSTMPSSGPVAPSRPADQPVDVVGEVKPQQVAAASGAAAAGAWSMQIASQPSEAAAQSSYQDLARRYGSVIGDKGVNIVRAEIAGKGTFWRVRVPAGSRNDAISLCESYKAAGGNCFVSK